MSGAVLPFTGAWRGSEQPPNQNETQGHAAIATARLIRTARRNNDDWTARVLLAVLQSLSRKQLELVEFRLLGENLTDQSGIQALAVVQLVAGDNAHRQRVGQMLDRLGGEAE